jgi:hypothetical protein
MTSAPLHDTPTDPEEILALLRQFHVDSTGYYSFIH